MPLGELVAAAAPDWVVLRERDLPAAERRELADRLRALLPPGRLIVAGPDPLGGDAVHLAEGDPVVRLGLVGRSCHAAPRLSTEDYVTLSPIFPTASKPGYGPAMGPDYAAELARRGQRTRGAADRADGPGPTPPAEPARRAGPGAPEGVPWLALGGVDSPERVAACLMAGAAGVAVMGAVMRAADPAATVARMRAAAVAAQAGHTAWDAQWPGGQPGELPVAGRR
ncbi:thiamine phosphate synthase [Krasilnikovia sp. M28-CT-15]|uniref:thiamine phosphate synthase n=1 Tax=Krasilnikovia sp. M28-CT-15 TaxID=3373540 RepID=UPI00399D382E